MQLKLRVGVGDTLTIDVKPTDTFQDLSDRLYNYGGVKVDLSQLKSNDKPFDMTTNVINYFLPKTTKENTDENGKPRRLCRLCSESIKHNPVYLFEEERNPEEDKVTLVEKVNSSLPIHVSVQDHLPKQICESCHSRVNRSFDFMKKVVDAQRTLEQVYNIRTKDKPSSNYSLEDNCPLCALGHFKHVDNHLRTVNGPHKGEKVLRKEVVISVPKSTTARKDLTVPRPFIKEEPLDPDYYSDDIVTGFWDPSSQDGSVDMYGMKRYRKRMKIDDDADWTIDEEYVPVSRRGRPRGTKNKPKVQVPVVEKSCVLCGWLGADTDMFAHAINQHCQPDMGYFPCPLCKTNQPNEMVLETHIDRHNARKRDK